jgi:hypothetical protein
MYRRAGDRRQGTANARRHRRSVDAAARRPAGRTNDTQEGHMTLQGNIHERDWSVEVETRPCKSGEFRCRVSVEHGAGTARFHHTFEHSHAYATEHEAMIEGLRAGMTWIEMKASQTFSV